MDFDLDLRYAVFAHVARLRDARGAIPSSMLNEGIVFRGERVAIWSHVRGIFRPRVLREPGAALSFQTSFDSPYDDRLSDGGEAGDRIVYRYQGSDPDNRDNQAMRRAMELGRPLLYLFGIRPGLYEAIFPCWVVGDDPDNLAFFVMADAEGLVQPPVDAPDTDWPRKAYVTRQVKQRLHQDRFRWLVLRADREQCTMCRLRHVDLLDAAHILPDRDLRGQPEVPNGLSLCKIHHSAYDADILGVDPDCRIHLRQDVLDEVDGPMLTHGLQEMHHRILHVQRRPAERPSRDYLAQRFDRFRAA